MPLRSVAKGEKLGVSIRHAGLAVPKIAKHDEGEASLLTAHLNKAIIAEKFAPASIKNFSSWTEIEKALAEAIDYISDNLALLAGPRPV